MPDEAPASPVNRPAEPVRDELDAAPPFLAWTTLYFIVAAALAVEVAAFITLTLIYR